MQPRCSHSGGGVALVRRGLVNVIISAGGLAGAVGLVTFVSGWMIASIGGHASTRTALALPAGSTVLAVRDQARGFADTAPVRAAAFDVNAPQLSFVAAMSVVAKNPAPPAIETATSVVAKNPTLPTIDAPGVTEAVLQEPAVREVALDLGIDAKRDSEPPADRERADGGQADREIVTASLGPVVAEAPNPSKRPAELITAAIPLPSAQPKLAYARPDADEPAKLPERLPAPEDAHTAVYDIEARTVYLPSGRKLEAHSGLGSMMDDPRYVTKRMRGATPPNIYDLKLRESLFHGVRAIRMKPVDDDKMFGRDGILAHSYMLGPNGQSNGCVSFKNYDAFLQAFLRGEVKRMVVVARLGNELASRYGIRRSNRYALDSRP